MIYFHCQFFFGVFLSFLRECSFIFSLKLIDINIIWQIKVPFSFKEVPISGIVIDKHCSFGAVLCFIIIGMIS